MERDDAQAERDAQQREETCLQRIADGSTEPAVPGVEAEVDDAEEQQAAAAGQGDRAPPATAPHHIDAARDQGDGEDRVGQQERMLECEIALWRLRGRDADRIEQNPECGDAEMPSPVAICTRASARSWLSLGIDPFLFYTTPTKMCGCRYRRGRFPLGLFLASARCPAATAARAHATISSGSSKRRSGTRQ